MPIAYHPEAEAELLDAIRFYDECAAGLGARFLRDFNQAILEIEHTAERFPIVENGLRRLIMQRFPFAIYFKLQVDRARILVVKHHNRESGYWEHRLDP